MKNLIILGSCGSIGTQTLSVLKESNVEYNVLAISVGSNLDLAKSIIEEFTPELVCCRTKSDMELLSANFKDIKFVYGDNGLVEVSCYKKEIECLLVSALVGSAGLIPTVEAIKIKRDVCLANKETLVMAGSFVMNLAREHNVNIFPIDSEHSAIWQCLRGENINSVTKLIITASGGALRDLSRDDLKGVSKEKVLAHPNWSMGNKITVDSATMMNKGFEVIEAHHLFNLPYDKIDTIMHKESIIHSLVEFEDCQVKAQLATSDMRLPILYALYYPNRLKLNLERLDLVKLSSLNFKELSMDRFPCLRYAYESGVKGNIYPTVLNASNEAAVNLFLDDKISFLEIESIIKSELDNTCVISDLDIYKIIEIDKEVKNRIYKKYGGK